MNKKYIIAAMATSFALNMNAQSVKVTGTVVDSNNEPVIGAYIKVKGSSKGAVTDLDGHYTIDADKNATLVISYVGMANQEEKIGNRSQINFVLKDDANDLNEVVVIGYGQVKKGDLTSSISAIKGDKLEKLSTGNVMNALQGQVNGVQISGAGGPGASPRVIIRGVTRWYACRYQHQLPQPERHREHAGIEGCLCISYLWYPCFEWCDFDHHQER